MAEASPLSAAEIRLVCALVSHDVRFMIVGLSAAALQGAPVVTQDVDLWVRDLGGDAFREALRSVGAAYVAPSVMNPPMLAGPGTDLFDLVSRMDGLGTFDDEWPQTIVVNLGPCEVHVLRLTRILWSKEAANRPKDRAVIPVLKDAIASIDGG